MTGSPGAQAESAQLRCGTTTYRIAAARISVDVRAACDRVEHSLVALQAYRASFVRFSCQERDGRVVERVLVPKELFDGYLQSCHEYVAAGAAFRAAKGGAAEARATTMRAYHAATTKFNGTANELARKRADDDSVLFRQRTADQGSMNALVRDLRGSIEATD